MCVYKSAKRQLTVNDVFRLQEGGSPRQGSAMSPGPIERSESERRQCQRVAAIAESEGVHWGECGAVSTWLCVHLWWVGRGERTAARDAGENERYEAAPTLRKLVRS